MPLSPNIFFFVEQFLNRLSVGEPQDMVLCPVRIVVGPELSESFAENIC